MPRRARIVVPGVPVHVVQRGNYRQRVFFSDSDREFYLALLAMHSAYYGLQILGWCLMSNHVHLIAVPLGEESLARTLGRTHGEYAQITHAKLDRRGHLWQARYFAAPMSEGYLWTALRYVEMNPVRAGLVRRSEDWEWSSAASHVGSKMPPAFLSMERWSERFTSETWLSRLEDDIPPEDLDLIRSRTKTDRPIGKAEFVRAMEERQGRVSSICSRQV